MESVDLIYDNATKITEMFYNVEKLLTNPENCSLNTNSDIISSTMKSTFGLDDTSIISDSIESNEDLELIETIIEKLSELLRIHTGIDITVLSNNTYTIVHEFYFVFLFNITNTVSQYLKNKLCIKKKKNKEYYIKHLADKLTALLSLSDKDFDDVVNDIVMTDTSIQGNNVFNLLNTMSIHINYELLRVYLKRTLVYNTANLLTIKSLLYENDIT